MFLLIVVLGFPGDSVVKNLPVSVGNNGSILGLERSHGERNSNPLQYSCLRNPIDRRSLANYSDHGVPKSQTYLPTEQQQKSKRNRGYCYLYTRQQKRHWCIEQSFGLCGRGRGWDDLGEWHWNMYNIIYETSRQSRFDTWYWMLGAGALGWPRGMVWGGRWEGGLGWGTRVHPWQIHVDVWQNQYSIVK